MNIKVFITSVITSAEASLCWDLNIYLNSCSLTTSPRYSMMNWPAFRGSLVLIPQPFSSARNRSRHCTHSCLCILWLQHCSPQGQVLGEHSAKIILESNNYSQFTQYIFTPNILYLQFLNFIHETILTRVAKYPKWNNSKLNFHNFRVRSQTILYCYIKLPTL